jgi:hypothetical protein
MKSNQLSTWKGGQIKTKKYYKELIIKNGFGNIPVGSILDESLHELLKCHPKREEKIGNGINYFYITKTGKCGNQVNIERIDKSNCSFSWNDCISGNFGTQADFLKEAMRNTIDHDVKIYKHYFFNKESKCCICKCLLNDDIVQVDHIYPFSEIAKKFLSEHTKDIPKEFDKHGELNTCIFKSRDRKFENDWKNYHNNITNNYQLLCQTCNGKKSNNF